MKTVKKPWGREEILVNTGKYVVKKLFINPDASLSYQYHRKKDETIVCLDGNCIVTYGLDKKKICLWKGEHLRIKPIIRHSFKGGHHDGCVLVECSTPELSDVVRVEDDYGRA